ncbi:hypothetical protein L1987_24863 [Smallanthus sonchifolius]|uniref:Uncharacterized protein n=1 Tax=Smallanthus sonchifolius TaxID=185202 RepID=A0ACB9IN29_9ASTR|nr:hypothetical protein L1987_24863 [Smallanthus sonchifolius]
MWSKGLSMANLCLCVGLCRSQNERERVAPADLRRRDVCERRGSRGVEEANYKGGLSLGIHTGIDESVSASPEPGNEESLGKEDDQVEEGEIVTSYPEVVAEQVHVHGEKVDLAANQEGTEEVSDLKSVANHDVPFTGMGNRNFQKKVIRRNSYKLGKAHPKKAASPAEERPKKRLRSALEDDLFGLDKILGLGPVRSQSPQIHLRVKVGGMVPVGPKAFNLNKNSDEGAIDICEEPIGVVELGGDKGDLCSAADRNPSEVLDKEIEAMIGIGRVVGSDMQEFPQLI